MMRCHGGPNEVVFFCAMCFFVCHANFRPLLISLCWSGEGRKFPSFPRPVLLQKKRRYLEGDIWSIFLSVVQISTKYRLCSKRR